MLQHAPANLMLSVCVEGRTLVTRFMLSVCVANGERTPGDKPLKT